MKLSVRAVHESVGVEIGGIDLSRDLDEQTSARVKGLLDEHALVLFRDQKLSPAHLARFGSRFGPLRTHDLPRFRVLEQPEVTVISNIVDEKGAPIGFVDVGHVWHTDASFLHEPHMYSFLHAIEIPLKDGRALGSTWFANSAHAYDALPAATKSRIGGLKAIHRFDNRYQKQKEVTGQAPSRESFKGRSALPDAIHPLVRTHPVTGRKSLYVNELAMAGIVGMPDEEARDLIGELCRHSTRDEYIYRHEWRVGDVLAWDNCSSQHVAIADYALPQRRFLYKVTVQGTAPS